MIEVTPLLRGISILLVEDSKEIQLVLCHIFRKAGAEVVSALNGKEAIDATFSGRFNVVLMDLNMPLME